ncbi:MAG: NUDIX hydrolase [Bacillota bacterium]
MTIPTLNIYADNLDDSTIPDGPVRKGARAVIVLNDKLVMLHLKTINLYTLPGGGIEPDETPEEALKREVMEETGYEVIDAHETVILKEHFPDSIWHHHFFRVKVDETRHTALKLTEEEKALDSRVIMPTVEEAFRLLDTSKSTHEHGSTIQKREFMGLLNSL